MADQQFCLRWNNHQSTLISVFDSLLENGTLVDCTLAAEGQYLKAHKVVLSACSPYLETLLSQHYEKHPIVILKDVKFSELKSMMDYMYRGEVNISQDQLGTFLKAAESLQIKGLSDNGSDGDGRDVGSTSKGPPPGKAQPASTNRPAESQRPASPPSSVHRSRDGSISPSSRKRRRIRRNSQGDDSTMGDSHLDSNSCDLPSQAQSTPIVPNIPATVTSSITTTPIKATIVKPEQTELVNRIDTSNLNSLPPESGLLKEKIEPISEPLLEPKTEYLDDTNNDDSVEDLTLDDDDEMDEMDISNMSNMSNISRPGPSHGNDVSQLSNQGYVPWQMGGNQTGTDEVFMAAQEAVQAHRGDSQGLGMYFDFTDEAEDSEQSNEILCSIFTPGKEQNQQVIENGNNLSKTHEESKSYQIVKDRCLKIYNGSANASKTERGLCLKCNTLQDRFSIYYHTKFFCGKEPPENLEWKMVGKLGSGAYCFTCKKTRSIRSIILHSKYMCGKKTVKCLFCPLVFCTNKQRSTSLVRHVKRAHGKSWDFIESVLSDLSKETLKSIEENNICIPLAESGEIKSVDNHSYNCKYVNVQPESHRIANSFGYQLDVENDLNGKGIGSKRSGKKLKYPSIYKTCTECSAVVRVDIRRFHRKFDCGKTPEEIECVKKKNFYECLRCKSRVMPHLIEFHLKYLCGKKPIIVQCFYCTILFKKYAGLLAHMKRDHKKKHHYVELLSILPEAEDLGSQNSSSKVVRHCFSGSVSSNILN